MIFIQWKLVLVLVIPIVVGVYSSLSKDHFSILVNGESLIFVNHYRLKPKLIEIDLKKCKNVQFFFTKVPRYGSDNIIFVLEDKTITVPIFLRFSYFETLLKFLFEKNIYPRFIGESSMHREIIKDVKMEFDQLNKR